MTTAKSIAEEIQAECRRHQRKLNELSIALAVASMSTEKKVQPTTLDDLISLLVCSAKDVTGITSQQLYGKSRCQRHCSVRFAVWHLTKQYYPSVSTQKLGRKFHREHGAIIYGLRVAQNMVDVGDAEFVPLINGIERRFKEFVQ